MTTTNKILFGLLIWAASANGQVAVIAHKAAPLDSLTKAQLLDYYSCEVKHWSKNQPVLVVDLKQQSEAKAAFYRFLGITASRMKSIWLKKLLMGEGVEPLVVKSEEEMLKKVASTPGALGFISADKVTDEVKTLLRITSTEKQP
ncbi:hypothetical protein HUU05_07340 [candidate division KSB1 bacterium]|nr:hypothetical protein [candidate division KSB1 bacterium]